MKRTRSCLELQRDYVGAPCWVTVRFKLPERAWLVLGRFVLWRIDRSRVT